MIVGSMEDGFVTALYAAIAGFIVGGGVKLANSLLMGKSSELHTHVSLRKELREELDVVKSELRQLQEELDEWREKYFQQVELTSQLKYDVHALTEQLDVYKNKYCPLGDDCVNNPMNVS